MNLEEHTITSNNGPYSRKVWFHAGPHDKPHPLCIVLDAEHYLRDMDVVPLIDELEQKNVIPQMTYVFISHVSAEDRHIDFQYNDQYVQFVANDVVDWAKEKVPSVQSQGNIICGLSLSGLMAAYISVQHPTLFSRCLAQSGSFWLRNEWWIEKLKSIKTFNTKLYLSVGDEEIAENVTHQPNDLYQKISQVAGVERTTDVLKEIGADVKFHIYEGGHAIAPWKEEFSDALEWLFS